MRILYIHQYFSTTEGSTGTRSYEFAKRLAAKGHQVTMITSSVNLTGLPKSSTTQTLHVDGIRVRVVPTAYDQSMTYSRRIVAFAAFAVRATFAAAQQKPDVVFASSTPLTVAIPGILTGWLRRCPFVFEVRDLWPEVPIALGALRFKPARFAARLLERLAYRQAKAIVALSSGMKAGIVETGVAPQKVTVIPNSSDLDLFDVAPSEGDKIRERLGIGRDDPLIVYTGAFGKANQVEWIIDVALAMRSIDPSVHFLLVGSGALWKSVYERARICGLLGETATIWPAAPKAQIAAVLNASTMCMSVFAPVAALENNSPNKVFDAFAAGRPVAVNHGGWLADLIRSTGAGITLPRDPHAAAKRLASLFADPSGLSEAREAARHVAHTRFSRDRHAHQLEAILRSVVEGTPIGQGDS